MKMDNMDDMPFSSKESLKLFILESMSDIANLHKALDHPTRIEILARLLTEELEFKDLQEKMNIPKTSLANHLSQLIDCSLVERLDRGVYQISFDGEDILKASAKVFLDIKIREQEKLEILRLRYEAMIKRYTKIEGEKEMGKDKFRIVELPPSKVVSFQEMGVFLGDPETKASAKMRAWVKEKKISGIPNNKHKIYGFNNPDPKFNKETGEFLVNEENPYGYEFWLTIDDDFDPGPDVTVKDTPGGLYVVSSCYGVHQLGEAWKELYMWIKESDKYKIGSNECLEQALNDEIDGEKIEFDLFFPISKK